MKKFKLEYEEQFYSQHGEDGIINLLINNILKKDYTFLEIGFGNGKVTNMSKNLLINQNYKGIGVDISLAVGGLDDYPLEYISSKIDVNNCLNLITDENITCDFFSLDIDSYDFDIMQKMFESGFRPKTICVEINRGFGESVASFPYKDDAKRLYNKSYFHGCSLNKYKNYLKSFGYEFFTVDTSGVNAFFYRKKDCNDKNLKTYDVLQNDYKEDKVQKVLSGEIEPRKDMQLCQYWKNFIDEIYKD